MTIDEGRHIATLAGDRGEFTVWKYGGHQLQIRESGFPRGVISTDAEAFPRYTAETLPVVLPCVLFGKVERALVLGLGSSESLSTAVAFPIPEIVCLETDAGLVRVARDVVSAQTGANPLDDERVTLLVCDPVLGLAASPGNFDVIVSSPENLGLLQAQPYLTAEFYRRAAA
jgi:spermidine synthase